MQAFVIDALLHDKESMYASAVVNSTVAILLEETLLKNALLPERRLVQISVTKQRDIDVVVIHLFKKDALSARMFVSGVISRPLSPVMEFTI